MTSKPHHIAAIGCSGHVSRIFLNGFLERGVKVRILARKPDEVRISDPGAEIVQGSMMNAADVARACQGVDAAFLVTPMGPRNNGSLEVEAAKAVIEGAMISKLPHLIYTSVLRAGAPSEIGIIDAKYRIERLLADSGIPRSVIRCGSYMEDVFDERRELLNKGTFLFPVNKDRRFTYTSQRDVPRFVTEELLLKEQILGRSFNFVAPGVFAVRDVEKLLSQASGFPIKATNKFPTFYLFKALMPYFALTGHRFSSIVPLIAYFDKHGYTDDGPSVSDVAPQFQMTDLETHLRSLWPSS